VVKIKSSQKLFTEEEVWPDRDLPGAPASNCAQQAPGLYRSGRRSSRWAGREVAVH